MSTRGSEHQQGAVSVNKGQRVVASVSKCRQVSASVDKCRQVSTSVTTSVDKCRQVSTSVDMSTSVSKCRLVDKYRQDVSTSVNMSTSVSKCRQVLTGYKGTSINLRQKGSWRSSGQGSLSTFLLYAYLYLILLSMLRDQIVIY